jgi:hypothetical protein
MAMVQYGALKAPESVWQVSQRGKWTAPAGTISHVLGRPPKKRAMGW